jgi:hypothetical protein
MLQIVVFAMMELLLYIGNQFTHPCSAGHVISQRLSVPLRKQNF